MSNRTNLKTLLPMLVFLLAMAGTTFAEPLLFPVHVGLRWEFNRSDGIGNEWTVRFEIDHQKTINSSIYFQLQRWNYENDGVSTDLGYVRLTDQAVYSYNPSGSGPEDDYLTWQKESVGTEWISYKADPHGFNYEIREITAIEPVTVPYGTFGEAYVHSNYSCVDPDELSEGQSSYRYDWVVPGVGWVKEVVDPENEGDPTMTMELVRTTFAEPSLLCPLQVGLRCEYNRRDFSGNDWTVVFEVDGQMTAKSFTYFHVQIWNYDNDSTFRDLGYLRSTENELYVYNPDGEDYLEFQKAPVGTKWSYYQEHDSGLNYTVTEIVDINTPENPVEVPYGTFDEAYVCRKYQCVNKFGQGKSPDWYNWVVPGIGHVKEVDYWNASPPMIQELVRVIIPADIHIDPNMLNVQSEGKWITWYIWLPEEYDVADIEPDSILLNGVIEAAWRWIDEEKKVLMAKFSRSEVQDIVEPGEVELTVSGELTDGTKFEGAVMITVID